MKMLLECFNHPVKITVSGFLVLLLTNTHNALISPHDLEEHLRSIAFNQTRSHHNPENKETTRDYIKSYWKRIALSNKDAVYISQTIPDIGTGDEGMNYILILPGRFSGTANDAPLVVGAHYDTAPQTPGNVAYGYTNFITWYTDKNEVGRREYISQPDKFFVMNWHKF